jgi:hypothetical protein
VRKIRVLTERERKLLFDAAECLIELRLSYKLPRRIARKADLVDEMIAALEIEAEEHDARAVH